MISIVKASLRLKEGRHLARFEEALRDPRAAQSRVLEGLIAANRDTRFGREHGFAEARTAADYARLVPLRDYEAFRPYVDRIVAGEEGVLTHAPVVMFTTTSGTTNLPKLVPVTAAWSEQMASLTRLWMLRTARDHPACFDRKIFYVASPAVEGRTPRGVPYGALTGVLHRRLPWIVRQQYSLPYAISILADPAARYFLSMRLALTQPISIACTPNPTSLLRLAETPATASEATLRAIHDGDLGIPISATLPASGYTCEQAAFEIRRFIRPEPERARRLGKILEEHGSFVPGLCWPDLQLIGCWLGGSAAIHASRVAEHLGPKVPLRDLGLLASEGRFTIPVEDNSAAGPLAVHTSFFEFVPEEEIEAQDPSVLLAHELRDGGRYYVILSGANGLYRYDINDVVEVQGFLGRTPKVRFLRKGRDMVSITGEKLHLNQIQSAVRAAEQETGVVVWQFRIIPDVAAQRYDLLIEACPAPDPLPLAPAFRKAFDQALALANVEYDSKRKSQRLHAPHLHLLRRGWSEEWCRADFRTGKREAQYKWPAIREAWDEASRAAVVESVRDADHPVHS